MNALRPLLRLAWREVTGHKARTALVLGLVTLMVGAAVAAGTIARTTSTTDDDFTTSQFAGAEAILHIQSGFFVESFEDPFVEDERRLTDEQLASLIETAAATFGTRGVQAQSIWVGGAVTDTGGPFRTPQTESLTVTALDLADPIVAPRYHRLSGRAPEAVDEVALTPRALDQQDREIGDTISIVNTEFTIVGEFARIGESFTEAALIRPEAVEELDIRVEQGSTEILFEDGSFFDNITSRRTEAIQAQIATTAGVPFESFWISFRDQYDDNFGFGGGFVNAGRPEQLSTLVAALFAVQVALVAAAAFAVGVARRTRQFGQLQATGASNPQLQQVVLIQAGITGLLGALVGTGLGFGIAFTAWTQGWLDNAGGRFPIDFRWSILDLVGPLLVGVGAAVAAAWWPTRRLRNLPPASALADHIPISRPTPRTPVLGLVALAGGTFLLLAVTGLDLFFGGSDFGTLLLVIAVLAMFGGALSSVGMLVHKIGERADRLGLLPRIVARNSARHQARSWVAVGALVAVVILPVVLGASTKAYPNSFANSAQADGWLRLQLWSDTTIEGQEAFFSELEQRVDRDLAPNNNFVVFGEDQRFSRSTSDFFELSVPQNNFNPFTSLEAIRGSSEILTAAGLDPDLWSQPNAPEAVVVPGMRERAGTFDGPVTRGVETVSFFVAEPADFLSYETWLLVSPETEQRFDLSLPPRQLFTEIDDIATVEDQEVLANLANTVWIDTFGTRASTAGVEGFVDVNSGLSGPTATQAAWIAIGGFTVLAIIISLVTSSLAAVEVDKEISTMIAAGAAPSMRRRLLGAQTAYHLFIAAVIGIPLALLMFWAATRADEFGPSGLTFPWTSMAMMGLVVPVIVGLAVAAIFRNGQPSVSRRV